MKFDICVFSENLSRKFKSHYSLSRVTDTSQQHLCNLIIISRCIARRIGNASDKICTENKYTHYRFNNFPPPPENRTVYEIMYRNNVELDRLQTTVWSKRVPCWIPKATNTHSQYVVLLHFPLQ